LLEPDETNDNLTVVEAQAAIVFIDLKSYDRDADEYLTQPSPHRHWQLLGHY
jgi:hypothetical protein